MKQPGLKHIGLFFFACLISAATVAQFNPYSPFQKINEENGLSDNNITCIFKDNNDFLWIGTNSGLNLIDGSAITTYENIPGSNNTLSNNHINCITQDSLGNIWIGTRNGLNCLNVPLRKFTQFPILHKLSPEGEEISSIVIDKNNNLYLAASSGLYYYDQKKDSPSPIEVPGTGYQKILNNQVTHLAFDNKNNLWASTYNGLWSYSMDTHHFTHAVNPENNPSHNPLITTFLIDRHQIFWLGTWHGGLKRFNPVTKTITTFPLPDSSANITSLALAVNNQNEENIFLNCSLLSFNTRLNHFVKNAPIPVNPTAVYYSGNNRLWIGTPDGLYFYKPFQDNFKKHIFPRSITDQGIALMEWNKNILVGAANDYFLRLYNKDLKEIRNINPGNSFMNVDCLTIERKDENTVRCGTSSGIVDVSLTKNTIQIHKLNDSSAKQSQLMFIPCLFQDHLQQWWIFPWRNGVWLRRDGSPAKKIFTAFETIHSIPKQLVISGACEDNNGNIWMSDYDEGIVLYKRAVNKFSKPFSKNSGRLSNASQIIYYRHYCYSFNATNLYFWNVDSNALHSVSLFPVEQKVITSIAADSSGHLWIATLNGLVVYDLKNKTLRHFNIASGLPSNKMDGSLSCLSDGTMLFGCANYLISFNPLTLLQNSDHIPDMKLSEVVVDGHQVMFDTSRINSLSYHVRDFIFRWAVTDYNDPLNNRYYYQLKGIDKDWRYAGKSGIAEFANLSSGHYTLLLKGINSNGIQAGKIISLQFDIAIPFWKSWWFFLLLLCLVAAFFYGLFRYRLRQALKFQNLRNKISLNLHDDIGSTLSSISILSEMALHSKKETEEKTMLNEIRENSLGLMERMDDIVWAINPRNDSSENLFLRVKEFAARLFEAKDIQYKIDISDRVYEIHLGMEQRQHLYLIMKEAINNLVKHSGCSEAAILVTFTSSVLSILIRDNGKGFPVENNFAGNGLRNMKTRVEEIGGQLEMKSEINKGSEIEVQLKIG